MLGALASGMLLYGCSLVYGFTGTLNFDVLAAAWTGEASPAAGRPGRPRLRRSPGLAFKMAAVPFHMWTPDVYEGAPSPVTAFMAGAPKVAAVGLMLRVLMGPFGAWTAAVAAGRGRHWPWPRWRWAPSPRSARSTSSG